MKFEKLKRPKDGTRIKLCTNIFVLNLWHLVLQIILSLIEIVFKSPSKQGNPLVLLFELACSYSNHGWIRNEQMDTVSRRRKEKAQLEEKLQNTKSALDRNGKMQLISNAGFNFFENSDKIYDCQIV